MALWSMQHPSQWVLGTLNIKQPGNVADHLPPPRAEVNNE